jgi:hypothetical protein
MKRAADLDIGEDISTTTVLLTNIQKRALRDRARDEGRSASEIVRQLLRSYLQT